MLSLLTLALISPAPLRAWQFTGGDLRTIPLPADIRPVTVAAAADLDSDGSPDHLLLARGALTIQSQGAVWSSPKTWIVQQALTADLDQDLQLEAVLLVRRPFRPWPVDTWLPHGGRIDEFHDFEGFSSHIILIGWDGARFREKWAGSALASPVVSLAVTAPGHESLPYLITLEKEYKDPNFLPARRMKVWTWNGFGFSVVSSVDGSFRVLTVVQAEDGKIMIITE